MESSNTYNEYMPKIDIIFKNLFLLSCEAYEQWLAQKDIHAGAIAIASAFPTST